MVSSVNLISISCRRNLATKLKVVKFTKPKVHRRHYMVCIMECRDFCNSFLRFLDATSQEIRDKAVEAELDMWWYNSYGFKRKDFETASMKTNFSSNVSLAKVASQPRKDSKGTDSKRISFNGRKFKYVTVLVVHHNDNIVSGIFIYLSDKIKRMNSNEHDHYDFLPISDKKEALKHAKKFMKPNGFINEWIQNEDGSKWVSLLKARKIGKAKKIKRR